MLANTQQQDDQCLHINKVDMEKKVIQQVVKNVKKQAHWVHLRLCLTCGHVGCCDSSPNKHGTKHHHNTKHPIIKSYEPGEEWKWCYLDKIMIEQIKDRKKRYI